MSDNLITAKSKRVMTTLGEWELLNITAVKLNHHDSEDNYVDELQFHVCLIILHADEPNLNITINPSPEEAKHYKMFSILLLDPTATQVNAVRSKPAAPQHFPDHSGPF